MMYLMADLAVASSLKFIQPFKYKSFVPMVIYR